MKALLDTNILIHRETNRVVIEEIGVLFRWLDRLGYEKCLHQVTIGEISKLSPGPLRDAFSAKIASYNVLQTQAPLNPRVSAVCDPQDVNDNDRNDTLLLNEVFCDRVDLLITEDRKMQRKAIDLGIRDRLYTIQSFLERAAAENPEPVEYKVLAVQKEVCGNIDLSDTFFESFRHDYPGFDRWFNRKSEEVAYVCRKDGAIEAFLYLKPETNREPYPDISPPFIPKKRLKIGTFKVNLNGFKLGERFLKIVFDNAIKMRADEVYVTIFNNDIARAGLIRLLEAFGFRFHGTKTNSNGRESVYVRSMEPAYDVSSPKLTFPYFSRSARVFIVPIYPEYHTNLFPDSILNTESRSDFVENQPYRNAIRKVYISRSRFKDLVPGDVIVFYRTGGCHRGVATTIGVVDNVHTRIPNLAEFIGLARRRSVFSDADLAKHWDYYPNIKPFVVDFLYAYSLPKRPNLNALIRIGVVKSVDAAPRGFEQISNAAFSRLLVEARADDRIVVD